MKIWALADLHLAFGAPGKEMDAFGHPWTNYTEKIEENWRKLISSEDLVLLPGDISWALKFPDALLDLDWIHRLPGTKLMIRGNHDYWWPSLKKFKEQAPSSMHMIQNNSFNWNGVAIAGARMWDSPEYSFNECIEFKENPRAKKSLATSANSPEDEKIFLRELNRLEISLKTLSKDAKLRIVMTHYPPIGLDLAPSRVSELLKKYKIDCCVFGHLHSVKADQSLFGTSEGTRYELCSCDYVNFLPIKLYDWQT
ncbi:MAG: phosphoesterase [Waddliaceae bacterium]|nr:phosphoesterase [Waddliaceae bacterium]